MFFNGSDYGDGEVAEEEYPVAEPHKPYDLKSEGSGDGESHGGSGGRYRRGIVTIVNGVRVQYLEEEVVQVILLLQNLPPFLLKSQK